MLIVICEKVACLVACVRHAWRGKQVCTHIHTYTHVAWLLGWQCGKLKLFTYNLHIVGGFCEQNVASNEPSVRPSFS